MSQGKSSTLKEIFSSVPQGGKWSDFLFDLDVSELADSLCGEAIPFGYADDVALWYEIDVDHSVSTAVINQDLQALKLWGDDNKTTFEPEKMSAMVISQKREPFNASGIIFNSEELSVVDETTLVGLVIDRRMRWGPMIKKLAVKARQIKGSVLCLVDDYYTSQDDYIHNVHQIHHGIPKHSVDGSCSITFG